MGAVDMVWRFTYQGFEDLGKFFSHTIGDWPTTGHNGPKWCVQFVDFRDPIEFGGDTTCGVHWFISYIILACLIFDPFKYVN